MRMFAKLSLKNDPVWYATCCLQTNWSTWNEIIMICNINSDEGVLRGTLNEPHLPSHIVRMFNSECQGKSFRVGPERVQEALE